MGHQTKKQHQKSGWYTAKGAINTKKDKQTNLIDHYLNFYLLNEPEASSSKGAEQAEA